MVKGAHGMLDQNPIYASEQFLKAEIHFTFAWTRTSTTLPAHHRKQSFGHFTVSNFDSVEIETEWSLDSLNSLFEP